MSQVTLDYDRIGVDYARYRRPDPRIAAAIERALGPACSVLDVGSGTGSYEPSRPRVVGVEPSTTMIRQRRGGAAPIARGVAEAVPFADRAFDAALAVLTVHHWWDARAGLREMRRVSSRQVVLTFAPGVFARFWLITDYLPQLAASEAGRSDVSAIVEGLGAARVIPVPVPWDCTDGFCGAYWSRPASYLDPGARRAISRFSRCEPAAVHDAMERLAHDLATGAWVRRHGYLLDRKALDLGYRLVVGGDDDDHGGVEQPGAFAWAR